jgi:hypothetical protein
MSEYFSRLVFSMAVTQAFDQNVLLHIIFSSVSGILLGMAGGVVFSRDRNSRLNQMFLGFFFGIGGHQILDGIMTYFLFGPNDEQMANLFRDFSILSLIFGLSFGALIGFNLYYGSDLFTKNNLVIWAVFTIILMLGGIFGDNVSLGGYYGDQASKTRNILGWIGITGSFFLYSTIIIVFLALMVKNVVDSKVRQKLIGITTGFFLINLVVFFFDISFVFPLFRDIIKAPLYHFLVHLIAVIGGFLTVGVLWTPMRS